MRETFFVLGASIVQTTLNPSLPPRSFLIGTFDKRSEFPFVANVRLLPTCRLVFSPATAVASICWDFLQKHSAGIHEPRYFHSLASVGKCRGCVLTRLMPGFKTFLQRRYANATYANAIRDRAFNTTDTLQPRCSCQGDQETNACRSTRTTEFHIVLHSLLRFSEGS